MCHEQQPAQLCILGSALSCLWVGLLLLATQVEQAGALRKGEPPLLTWTGSTACVRTLRCGRSNLATLLPPVPTQGQGQGPAQGNLGQGWRQPMAIAWPQGC